MLTKNIMLYGGKFLNFNQQNVVTKFLLNNDKFKKTAEKLALKTDKIVAIIPGSKESSGVFIKILKNSKNLSDADFVKDKNGQDVLGYIYGKDYMYENLNTVETFIKLIEKYINNFL